MNLSFKSLLQRGLVAGAAGGLCTALFLLVVVETQIGKAIGFEDASALGMPPGEAAMFTRSTQHLGGMLAATIFGTAVGALFAVVVALVHHRVQAATEFGRTIRIAAAAFVATAFIPAMKYPSNPPTVGDPETINQRTFWFLLLMVVGVLLMVGSFRLWEIVTDRGLIGAPRFSAVTGALLVATTATWMIFPASPDPIEPPDNDGPPALVFADTAPAAVLDEVLTTGRATGRHSVRNPDDPSIPLDLDTVDSGTDLRGVPVAISTTALRPDVYTTMVWHFRTQSLAGLALMWLVTGTLMGFLLDRKAGRSVPEPAQNFAHSGTA